VPARAAATGKRTSTRSLAGTFTRTAVTGGQLRVGGADRDLRLERLVRLILQHDGQLDAIAEVQEAGAEGRTIRGRRAVIVDSPLPKWLPEVTATAVTR